MDVDAVQLDPLAPGATCDESRTVGALEPALLIRDEVLLGELSLEGVLAQVIRSSGAALTPLDQLLVETDSPFLTPIPHRGRPNGSRLVPHTVRALAGTTGTDLAELCDALTRNAERVFGAW